MQTSDRVLKGRYRLGRLLGRGGMAEVYEAHDERLDRPVAVKLLRPDMAADTEVRSRFEIEARSAARLHHPNVVSVFDTGEDAGDPYLVMELLPGESVADRVGAGPVDPEWLRRVAGDVLAALGAAHGAGLVHRDVKPGNVLLAADGVAKVADFGIAKSMEAAGGDMTSTGMLLGTPAYLAPERIEGLPATPRSDLYSVGVMLYEALAGVKPFVGNTPMAVASAIITLPPPPLDLARPGLDPAMVAAVERAMAKDPMDRPSSAAEMATDLGLADRVDATVDAGDTVVGTVASAVPDATVVAPAGAAAVPSAAARGVAARMPRPLGRRPAWWIAAAVVALVFIVVVALAQGGGGGARGKLAARMGTLAQMVETGDGPKGAELAAGLRDVAGQVKAGGGSDAATELIRSAVGWKAAGLLSESAFTKAIALLREVPGVNATVLTTTTTAAPPPTTVPPPPPPNQDGGHGKGKGQKD